MRRVSLYTMLVLGLVAAGCGGSSHRRAEHRGAGGRRGEQGEEREREQAAKQIPRRDRIAFIAIATASGAVRARAALIVVGRRERPESRSAIARARGQLIATAPRDRQLVGLKRQTLEVVMRADRLAGTRSARSLLAATTTIDAGLRQYAQRHPAIGRVIPD